MSKSSQFILGGKSLPLDEGQVLALGDGLLQFDFAFRHIRLAVRYEETVPDSARLKVVGDVGPLPYSAEAPAARAGLARIVEAAELPGAGPLFRVVQGRILLGREAAIPAPVTAAALIAGIARLVVPAIPYLDLVAVYVRPPLAPAKPGESAVRPEWRRRLAVTAPGR